MEEFCAEIGERLKAERDRLGRTQPDFAALAGASKRTLQDWERGVSSPTAAALKALSASGVDVRWVITGSRDYEPPPALTAEEQVLLERWREASREVRNAAFGALLGAAPIRSNAPAPAHLPRINARSVSQTKTRIYAGPTQVYEGPIENVAGRDVVHHAPAPGPKRKRKGGV